MEKKYKVKLNSVEKVEGILQEVYDDSMRQLTLIQNKINELEQSTNLSDEPIDMKAKYAMHDYITDKEKAIGRKLDVSKLMSEILKQNGDVDKVLSDKDIMGNLDDAFAQAREHADNIDDDADKTETYITNKIN
jgi:cell wall assembly regulator SMI1